MPATKRRVLHDCRECGQLFEELARRGHSLVRFAFANSRSGRKSRDLCGIDMENLLCFGFQMFYRDTELAMRLDRATAVIDVPARTIILTKVRLRHRVKYLPKTVHDIRLY
jgi:hypothetical protein